jgi:hypothetical protein
MKFTLLVALMGAWAIASAADSKQPPTAGERIATGAAAKAARIAVGTAIGGTVGRIIVGGPVGAGIGAVLSPTKISTQQDRVPPRPPKGPATSTGAAPRGNAVR